MSCYLGLGTWVLRDMFATLLLSSTCFLWFLILIYIFFDRRIDNWIKRQRKKVSVRKSIHTVVVEPSADSEAMAFALAVSDIDSDDLFVATTVHPDIKERFSNKGKRRIATKAFLLRKDEHDDFIRHFQLSGKLRDALREETWRERHELTLELEFARNEMRELREVNRNNSSPDLPGQSSKKDAIKKDKK